MKDADNHVAIQWHFCTPFDTNIQHWWNRLAAKKQKSISNRWPNESLHQVHLYKYRCRKHKVPAFV